MTKKYVIVVLVVSLLLTACAGNFSPINAEEANLKTLAGREAYIAAKYEGAKILSESKNPDTDFIVSEFSAGELHSAMYFRPTESGYAYNGECVANDVLDCVTMGDTPMGDGMYFVFLRHSDAIDSLEVARIDDETDTTVQKETISFGDTDMVLMKQTSELPVERIRLVAYDEAGEAEVLLSGAPIRPKEEKEDSITMTKAGILEYFLKKLFD